MAVVLSIAILSVLHFIISFQVRRLLPKLVTELSAGNYELIYRRLDFRYLKPEIMVAGIDLKPKTKTLESAYYVHVDSVFLSIESFIPLLLKKGKINVDEIRLSNPTVVGKRTIVEVKSYDNAELHVQVNRLQENAMRFLHALEVDKCTIDNGRFQYYPFPGKQNHFNLQNIDLFISDLIIPDVEEGKNKMISADIMLEIEEPFIQLPDTALYLYLKKFRWNNKQHFIEADSFDIAQVQSKTRDGFKIKLDTIRVRKIDWPLWLKTGIVQLDTVLASDGNLFFSSQHAIDLSNKKNIPKPVVKLWDALGDLDIHHFSAKKIKLELFNKLTKKERNYSLMSDTLMINGLSIRRKNDNPISVNDISLSVRDFKDNGSGNKFTSSFSKLQFKKNIVQLNDYSLLSNAQSQLGEGSSLFIPKLTLFGVSLQDLLDKKADVKEISMESPYLSFKKWNTNGKGSFSGLEDIRPFVDVDRLIIHNASIELSDEKRKVFATGVSAEVLPNELLKSYSTESLLKSFKKVIISDLDFKLPLHHLVFHGGQIDYPNKSLRFLRVQTNLLNENIKADLNEVSIDAIPELRPFERGQIWKFKNVNVRSGVLKYKTSAQHSFEGGGVSGVVIDDLELNNIQFNYIDRKAKADAFLQNINAKNARFANGMLNWELAETNGEKLTFKTDDFRLSSMDFRFHSSGESILNSALLQIDKPNVSAQLKADQIVLSKVFNRIDLDTIEFDKVSIIRPVLHASILQSTVVKENESHFKFGAKEFMLNDPSIHVSMGGSADPFHFDTDGSFIKAKEFYWNKGKGTSIFSAQNISADLNTLALRSEGREIFQSGKILTSLSNIHFNDRISPSTVFDIDQFTIQNLELSYLRRGDTMRLHTNGMDIRSMNRLYLSKDSIIRSAFKLPVIRMYPGNFIYRTPNSAFDIYQLDINTENKLVSFDSLVVLNKVPRNLFFQQQPFEKDYFTVRMGKLKAFDVQPLVESSDTIAYARKIYAEAFYLKAERDKRVKDDTITYRPLLAGMLRRLKVPVIVDSVVLQNANIIHNVIDEKTEKEGTIFFTNVDADIQNLKNVSISDKDSIYLDVRSRLMGVGDMQLRYKQSYSMPAQNFHLGIRMGDMELQELNRLVMPLHSVKLEAGRIDRLALDVNGNDSISYGKIKMDYTDLKVSVVNIENKRRSLLSILANIFVRSKNSKTNPILAERLKEKSVFNYWSRISLNGLLTSIGVRTDGKKTRQFFRKMEKNSRVENLF